MRPPVFWTSALAASAILAGILAFLFPYEAIGVTGEADRTRTWLLLLWTSGVLGICFGAAGLLGAWTPLGFSDVAEHGSVAAAAEARKSANRQAGSNFYNFAGWMTASGILMIVIYFIFWTLQS